MNRIIFLAAFIVILAACGQKKESEAPKVADPYPHYPTTLVSKTEVDETEQLPAQLAAYQEVSIFPKVNGYVKTVRVDIGSHVQAGQLLMVLEAPEMEEATVQAREKFAR